MAMMAMRRRVSAVVVLVAVNAAIFAYEVLRPHVRDEFEDFFGLSAAGIEEGRWWQLITHAFLHANIWHLLFNMIALWFAGRIVERVMGTSRFLALYVASAVAGGLAQTFLEGGNALLLGASGAVCGVIVAFATMFPEAPIVLLLFFVIPLKFRAKYLGWGLAGSSLLLFVLGFEPWIGHAAHLGGCVAGYLLARLNGYGVPTPPERLLKKWFSWRAN
jgi:membrane associated rhomboid family serine protease